MNQKYAAKDKSQSESSSDASPSLTLGIVTAPEAASEIAHQLTPHFSDLLGSYVDDYVSWEVEVVVDPFTGGADTASSILEEIETLKQNHDWDYAVGISDLPFFVEKHFLVAEANGKEGIALISLPTLGAFPMLRRVREATLHLVSEMYHGSSEEDRDSQAERISQAGKHNRKLLHNIGERRLVGKGWIEQIAPVHRIYPTQDEDETTVRFVARSRLNGYVRVAIGMVRANHPLKILSAFRSVVAAAFTTGAFALIFPTLWKMGDTLDGIRATALMFTSIIALTGWMIISNELWEKKRSSNKDNTLSMRKLYNITTIATIGTGVICYYIVLFVCFFLATFLFIPPELLESSTGVGHPVGVGYFVFLAWVTTSLATWLGALGAGIADQEKVLNATYGYRQLRQKRKAKQEEEEKNDK